ncbi:hypothetical protein SAMN04488600_10616 [Paenibacillus polymyxa]|nr:hypothetical protein SAMN04488600_10616 [Paenibacillus polymyxa]
MVEFYFNGSHGQENKVQDCRSFFKVNIHR